MNVACRCGRAHLLSIDPTACVYCRTPTFDSHRVCARCRPFESLELFADFLIDDFGT